MINRIQDSMPTEPTMKSADGGAQAGSDSIAERLNGAVKSIERFIATKPEICLGVALGIGVVTGWIIKRRK
jgi:ElaB/YqjD/DUF883 family membrane-anchored ribosome-binding protein